MCPCGSDLWWVIVNVIHVLGLVCELTMAWVGLCNMSLGLWCAGVELGGSGWRWGEGQVGTCRADGLEVVNDGREAWTEGPRGRVTSRGGWQLGTSTSASVHGSDRVDRVKMANVQAERRLWKTWRPGGRGRRWHALSYGGRIWSALLADGLIVWASKPSGGRFPGLGLKTLVEVLRRNGAARGGIIEFTSRRSKSVQEVWMSIDKNRIRP
jgi:hypothetical protein